MNRLHRYNFTLIPEQLVNKRTSKLDKRTSKLEKINPNTKVRDFYSPQSFTRTLSDLIKDFKVQSTQFSHIAENLRSKSKILQRMRLATKTARTTGAGLFFHFTICYLLLKQMVQLFRDG